MIHHPFFLTILLPGFVLTIVTLLLGVIRVAFDDITAKYLLLSSSHDGKSSVTFKFTPVPVVSQNTLTLAPSSCQRRWHRLSKAS